MEFEIQKYIKTNDEGEVIEFTLPSKFKIIYCTMFIGMFELKTLKLHNEIEYVVPDAFNSCPKLEHIIHNNHEFNKDEFINSFRNKTEFDLSEFYDLKRYNFEWCIDVVSIKLPNTLTKIGRSMFNRCSKLTSINIPSGVRKISINAFGYCGGLKTITIPNSVTKIGANCFQNCTSLSSITLSTNLKELPDYTFLRCSNLESIEIPTSVQSISWSAFAECDCKYTRSIPEVKQVKNQQGQLIKQTFYKQEEVKGKFSTIIYNGVKYNPNFVQSVFISKPIIPTETWKCPNQIKVTELPTYLTKLNYNMFKDCSNLRHLEIPITVKKITKNCFINCTKLATLIVPTSIKNLTLNMFGRHVWLPYLTIYDGGCKKKIQRETAVFVIRFGILEHFRPSMEELTNRLQRYKQFKLTPMPMDIHNLNEPPRNSKTITKTISKTSKKTTKKITKKVTQK